MLDKTRGIYLHHIKYAENSVIAGIYTEKYGRLSFIINNTHSRKGAIRPGLLQPLTQLDLELYYKPGRELHRLKSARLDWPYSSIPFDIRKSTQVIFLAEVLFKTLREEESNPELYQYLTHALHFLDLTDEGIANFHLLFLLNLTQFLGIFPGGNNPSAGYFDMHKGSFVLREPTHPHYMNQHISALFLQLFSTGFSNIASFRPEKNDRKILLEKLLDFYRIHFEHFGEVKSLRVLQDMSG